MQGFYHVIKKKRETSMKSYNNLYKKIAFLTLVTGFFLLIPIIGMKFSQEVMWTLSDFIIAGILLFGTGLLYLLITRKPGNTAHRIAVAFALLTGLFLIWSNLAVGIIGSEGNTINLWYFGVVLLGLIGGFIGRFKSQKMVAAMSVMAIATALIVVIALVFGMYELPGSSVNEILTANGFFVVLFLFSAFLFRYAGQKKTPAKVGKQVK